MQTSNQTVDAMLAKPSSSATQGDGGASAVSNYNKSDNSFDNVLEQQRNRHSRTQRQDGPAEQKKPPVGSGASENQQKSAVNEASGGGSEAATGGNALPAEAATPALVEASELSGVLLSDPDLEAASSADEAESVLADNPGEPELAEQTENQVGGELVATQKARAEQQAASDAAVKPQRVVAAPAGIIAPQREARDAAITLPQAMADQASSGRGDNAALQETQAFKDALQQLRNGAATPAAPVAAVASTEAADSVEQATRNLVRVDQLLSSTQAVAAKPEVAMSTIQVPVSSPNWSQAVAQRVLWLASNGVQAAELQLHPRELGPVDIRISVANDQTQVQFSSQYGVVRESLEASMQRLRELFDASGLQLVDVNVSDQSLAEQHSSEDAELVAGKGQPDAFEETAPLVNAAAETITGAGLVDYYA